MWSHTYSILNADLLKSNDRNHQIIASARQLLTQIKNLFFLYCMLLQNNVNQ